MLEVKWIYKRPKKKQVIQFHKSYFMVSITTQNAQGWSKKIKSWLIKI